MSVSGRKLSRNTGDVAIEADDTGIVSKRVVRGKSRSDIFINLVLIITVGVLT